MSVLALYAGMTLRYTIPQGLSSVHFDLCVCVCVYVCVCVLWAVVSSTKGNVHTVIRYILSLSLSLLTCCLSPCYMLYNSPFNLLMHSCPHYNSPTTSLTLPITISSCCANTHYITVSWSPIGCTMTRRLHRSFPSTLLIASFISTTLQCESTSVILTTVHGVIVPS